MFNDWFSWRWWTNICCSSIELSLEFNINSSITTKGAHLSKVEQKTLPELVCTLSKFNKIKIIYEQKMVAISYQMLRWRSVHIKVFRKLRLLIIKCSLKCVRVRYNPADVGSCSIMTVDNFGAMNISFCWECIQSDFVGMESLLFFFFHFQCSESNTLLKPCESMNL